MNKQLCCLFAVMMSMATLSATITPDTSLQSVQNVADQVRSIERQLSALILTLDVSRFPWIQKDIETLVVQLRSVLVGAHGGYGESYTYRCRAALEAGYQVLKRLVVKIESTIAFLETRRPTYASTEKRSCLMLERELCALKNLVVHECDAMKVFLPSLN